MDKAFGALKGTLATLGASVSVIALKSFVQGSIDAADHLNDLSKKTGIAVETLGGLGFAAKQSGGDLDSFADATTKLNRSIAEAGAGNEAKLDVFKKIGISVKDATGQLKTADQVMIELADRFESYADGPNKVAIAIALLGKAGADQIPILNEGGRKLAENVQYYERYSGVTKDVAERADQFNDTLVKLNLLSGSLGTKIASELLGPLQSLADYILRAKEESTAFETAAGGVKTIFEALVVAGANVAFVFRAIGTEIGGITAQLVLLHSAQAKALRLDFKGALEDGRQALAIGKELRADAESARKNLDQFEQRVLGVGPFKKTAADTEDAEAGRFRLPAKKREAPGLPDAGAKSRAEAAAKAFAALTEAQTKIAVEAEATAAKNRLAVLDHFYKEGFAGEERYWEVRFQIQKSAYDVERAALDANVANRTAALSKTQKGTKEYYDAQKELAEAQAKRNKLDADFNAQGNQDVLARAKATEDYERAIKNLNVQLLELKGNTAAATQARLELQNESIRKQAQGRGDAEGEAVIDSVERATVAQARFNELREQASDVTARLALEEERIQNSLRVGAITAEEAERRTEIARRNTLGTLQLTKEKLDAIANSDEGFLKLRLAAEQFGVSLETLAAQSNLLEDRARSLFEGAVVDGWHAFREEVQKSGRVLDGFIKGFERFALRIAGYIEDIAAKNLAQAILGETGSGGIGGFLAKLLNSGGASSSAPLEYTGASTSGVNAAIASGTLFGSYATGTDYVPRTGPYLLHQGEQVIPAGEGGGVTIAPTIHIDSRADSAYVRQQVYLGMQQAVASIPGTYRRGGAFKRQMKR